MTYLFTINVLDQEQSSFGCESADFIVAGYTGRDELAVREHIDELAAIGVAPPPQVPMLYELSSDLISTSEAVAVAGGMATGEVEPVLIRHGGRWYLGIGSDLTDRDLERDDVKTSKAACPKPMGKTAVLLPADVADGGFDAVWDLVVANSYVDDELYQSGSLASLRRPSDIIQRIIGAGFAGDSTERDVVVFTGTIPLVGGKFREGQTWRGTLTLPDGRVINHEHNFVRTAQ